MEASQKRPRLNVGPKKCVSLVTGGSGFIGRHLVAALRSRGDVVRVLDLRGPADHSEEEFIEGSILNPETVRRAMEGVSNIYHLAAISHLWTSDQADYERVNHIGTKILLSVAAQKRIPRFVHCSTEGILFPPVGRSAEETISLSDMAGPYTRSKFLAEQVALAAVQKGLPVVVVNPTVPIGPGDHNFTPPTAMLAHFVRRPPFFILDCTLNLVDVRDIAKGIILAAERGRIGQRYVLGGENIRVRELVRRIGVLRGRKSYSFSLPHGVALAAGKAAEWFARNVSHRTPLATVEGVSLALRSMPLHDVKARIELGYSPHPVNRALADAVSWLSSREPMPRIQARAGQQGFPAPSI